LFLVAALGGEERDQLASDKRKSNEDGGKYDPGESEDDFDVPGTEQGAEPTTSTE
jgi:hypothetical protein